MSIIREEKETHIFSFLVSGPCTPHHKEHPSDEKKSLWARPASPPPRLTLDLYSSIHWESHLIVNRKSVWSRLSNGIT